MKQSQPANTYRYERKFLIEAMDAIQVRALVRLHPGMFLEAYPPRFINNIYLDTPEMDYYYENVHGVDERRKVRIRWYGDLFGHISKPSLEFKIKKGVVGRKESYPFPAFDLDEGFDRRYFRQVQEESALPQEIRYFLRDLDPVLVNRYHRWYYVTPDKNYRLTVDSGMCFYHIDGVKNTYCHRQFNYMNVVVELKYDTQHDPRAGRISQYFPFPATKNSKYVEGIERVYL